MSRIPLQPRQDPLWAAALYLSGLDHESLYSNAELKQAISEATAPFDWPDQLLHSYTTRLGAPGAHDSSNHSRREWALRMAAELDPDNVQYKQPTAMGCRPDHQGRLS